MCKYSVLMSLYIKENPDYLQKAIDSMLNQTVRPDEIVIVRDGPITVELENVLNEYAERYPGLFKIVGYEKNRGLGLALNFGLSHCKNELVARMDTDDISIPTRCEQELMIMENNDIDVVGGNISEFIGEQNNIVSFRKVPRDDIRIKKYMKKRCPLNHMTVMFKKKAVIRSGNYMDLFWNEDYYLWIRMMQNGCKFANTGTLLVNVRIGEEMYARRGGIKYFYSEKFLQDYMLEHKIIGLSTYCINIIKRFIIQVFLPNKIRGWVFRRFARSRNE